MRHLKVRIVIAVLTFAIGLVVSGIVKSVFHKTTRHVDHQSSSIEDQWHRLYWAAQVSGDPAMPHKVHKRLLCTNRQGMANAHLIDTDSQLFCQTADGINHQLSLTDSSECGAFAYRIINSRQAWTRQNLDLFKSIRTADKAHEYLREHKDLWEAD